MFLIDGHALTPLTVLTDVRDKDLLIAFSLRRYRRETTKIGELFHAAGGKLVLVTDSDDAPSPAGRRTDPGPYRQRRTPTRPPRWPPSVTCSAP